MSNKYNSNQNQEHRTFDLTNCARMAFALRLSEASKRDRVLLEELSSVPLSAYRLGTNTKDTRQSPWAW